MTTVRLRPLLALALAAFALSCNSAKKETNEILIGSYLSETGADSTFGIDTRHGIELAVDEVNNRGGIKGKKVKVVFEDDQSKPDEASNKVRQLIDRDKVIALLGEVSSKRSLAGGLIAQQKQIPMVTPSSTAVEVTKGRDWVFRACFTDAQQGDVAARFVYEKLGKRKVAIIYAAQEDYSAGLAKTFREVFTKLGGTIIIEKSYQEKEAVFTTYVRDIKAANPEAIFAPVYYTDMGNLSRDAKREGLAGNLFVGSDGWDSPDLLSAVKGDLDGSYLTDLYAADSPGEEGKAFVKAYQGRYKADPNSLSAQGYDAARMLFDAITRAKEITPAAIKVALAETKDFPGVTGKITIDKDHNANKPVVVVQVKANKFSYHSELLSQ